MLSQRESINNSELPVCCWLWINLASHDHLNLFDCNTQCGAHVQTKSNAKVHTFKRKCLYDSHFKSGIQIHRAIGWKISFSQYQNMLIRNVAFSTCAHHKTTWKSVCSLCAHSRTSSHFTSSIIDGLPWWAKAHCAWLAGWLACWLAGWLGVWCADMWLLFCLCPPVQTRSAGGRQRVRNQLWVQATVR